MPALARRQPAHGVAEAVLVGVGHAEFRGRGGGLPQPGVGEPGSWRRRRSITMARARSRSAQRLGDQAVEAGPSAHGKQGLDIAVRQGALDGKDGFRGDQALYPEDNAQGLDLF